jgi:hypothetical protein
MFRKRGGSACIVLGCESVAAALLVVGLAVKFGPGLLKRLR